MATGVPDSCAFPDCPEDEVLVVFEYDEDDRVAKLCVPHSIGIQRMSAMSGSHGEMVIDVLPDKQGNTPWRLKSALANSDGVG